MQPRDELGLELLRRSGRLVVKARGSSMLPFLRDGDVAHVRAATGGEVRIGDVVCYEPRPGRLVLHRVVKRSRERVVVKGDALDGVDELPAREILGKVVAVERHGRLTRLDSRVARWVSRVIVVLSPVLPRLLSLGVRVRRLLRRSPWAS